MEIIKFFKNVLSSDSATSSKRLCGLIGWIICITCVIYSVLTEMGPSHALDTLFLTSTALLGLDTVANIFKKN